MGSYLAGEVLRKKREELGIDIREVSELLRIKADYLTSIEEDKFEKLPVAVYTIGYIRSYAVYLHVDPEPIISFYTGHLSQPGPSTIIPVSSSKKTVPFYYYVIPFLVLLLVVFGIIILRQGTTIPPAKPASVPLVPAQPEIPRQEVPIQEAAIPAPQEGLSANNQPRAEMKVSPSTGHRLEIIASDLTWVLFTFSDGETEEALLRPGITKTWEFSDEANLKLGNAGGVRLNLDGKDLGTPGSHGQVMTISFPENRQIPRQSPPPGD